MLYRPHVPRDVRIGDDCRVERGAALAELALVVPIMLVLLLVVFDFGRGFLDYVSVSNGARDGARVAAQYDVDCSDSADIDLIKAAAVAAAAPLAAPTPKVTVAADTPKTDQCSVTVEHKYDPVIPFIDAQFELVGIGTVGPLWDGSMSETMVSQ